MCCSYKNHSCSVHDQALTCSLPTEGLNGSWKDGGFTPSSYSSSGFWSWSAPSDQSNPSTPSPPLSADSFRPFRMSSLSGPPDDTLDEQDTSSLLFDEPIPRKRKVSDPLLMSFNFISKHS